MGLCTSVCCIAQIVRSVFGHIGSTPPDPEYLLEEKAPVLMTA